MPVTMPGLEKNIFTILFKKLDLDKNINNLSSISRAINLSNSQMDAKYDQKHTTVL